MYDNFFTRKALCRITMSVEIVFFLGQQFQQLCLAKYSGLYQCLQFIHTVIASKSLSYPHFINFYQLDRYKERCKDNDQRINI